LPLEVQYQAIEAYRLFKKNPYHSGLRFKCIDPEENIYSVRIGLHYRAVGVWKGDTIIWYFIGSHEDYNHL
jgi:hypothetical protein